MSGNEGRATSEALARLAALEKRVEALEDLVEPAPDMPELERQHRQARERERKG